MAILLTNDDGIDAPGLAALAEAMAGLDELHVSAPADNRSGVGMGITLNRPLKLVKHPDGTTGEKRYSVDGTPADAAKYGLQHVLNGQPPRLVVSGINKGPNLGINVRCSGTVGAAFEAAAAGLPALAVSVEWVEEVDWTRAQHYARMLAQKIMSLPGGFEPFVLNLNVPSLPPEKIRGLVIARHGRGGIQDYLNLDPDGETLHFGADWIDVGPDGDCDAAAFSEGYAVVTPLRFEMTDDAIMAGLCESWKDDLTSYKARVRGN